MARTIFRRLKLQLGALCCAWLFGTGLACSAELRGLITLGTAAVDSRSDSFSEGMNKSPFGIDKPAARMTVRADWASIGDLNAGIIADADSQRSGVFDVQEAWIGWNPVPQSPLRLRVKAGAFFPVSSLEVGYDSVGWNAERTLSSSAINSWIAEEIRILGTELTVQWRGLLVGSPHTLTARFGVFGGNDPAGTELAWRGWNVGGRVTGLFQNLRLPDLPVYRPDGAIPLQTRTVHEVREIDHRAGAYASLGYGRSDWLDLEAMHYDNRGDPLRVTNGQYSWHTRFDHLSLKLQLPRDWQLLSQVMSGDTKMGPNAVNADFSSWYMLLSGPLGPGRATLRHDRFRTAGRDVLPADPNDELGHAWAIAYAVLLPNRFTLVAEVLRVASNRGARSLIGAAPHLVENSLGVELRRTF
jgi:hypothetical protein